jgi:hypothetical protein
LVIDRPILELLNIDPETPLDVSTDGKQTDRRACERLGTLEEVRGCSEIVAQAIREGVPEISRVSLGTNGLEPEFLSLDEVLEIHEQQIELYGGSTGLRDAAGLESAVATPQATFGVELLYRLA